MKPNLIIRKYTIVMAVRSTVKQLAKELTKPKKRFSRLSPQKLITKSFEFRHVFTDGGADNNGKKNCIAGIGVFFEDDDPRNLSEHINDGTRPTSIRAELTAIIRAIDIFYDTEICDQNPSKPFKLYIHTDSQFVINVMTKWIEGWKRRDWKKADGKPVQNIDLISVLDHSIETKKDMLTVKFDHVKAHRQPPRDKSSYNYFLYYGNMMADQLATEGKYM
jgi:ribonuclease HI